MIRELKQSKVIGLFILLLRKQEVYCWLHTSKLIFLFVLGNIIFFPSVLICIYMIIAYASMVLFYIII